MKNYYLDHCATTPLANEVKEVLSDLLNRNVYGNPSASHHAIGSEASHIVENARAVLAKEFDVPTNGIIFCGSAVEASNLAIYGFVKRFLGRNPRIFYGATEHKAVLYPCEDLKAEKISVNHRGEFDIDRLEDQLRSAKGQPTLVCIMAMNNEIPVRYPIEKIAELCIKYDAYFHCDGVQALLRESLSFKKIAFSSLIFSGHKIYGPKGIGVLVLPKHSDRCLPVSPHLLGGDQEFGIRPGTHNTHAIAGLQKAVELLAPLRQERLEHMRACDKIFVETMTANSKKFRLTVPLNETYPGIVNFWLDGVNALVLLRDLPHICINRGAACLGAGGEKISHVPSALGLPTEIGSNVLRASFGSACSVQEVMEAAKEICDYARH